MLLERRWATQPACTDDLGDKKQSRRREYGQDSHSGRLLGLNGRKAQLAGRFKMRSAISERRCVSHVRQTERRRKLIDYKELDHKLCFLFNIGLAATKGAHQIGI